MNHEARRSFITRLGAGITAFGAALAAGGSRVHAQSREAAASPWRPARHTQDGWLEQLPGKHRCFFDTASPDELAAAIQFAGNYFEGSSNGYGLENGDLAVVIGLRHRTAPFGYSDAIWAKYSVPLAARAQFTDPKTKEAPATNYYNSGSSGSRGANLATLAGRGVHFSVCDLSTHTIAGLIAQKVGGKADAIYAELAANLVVNGRLVPAGIVALNRAQEHGYTSM